MTIFKCSVTEMRRDWGVDRGLQHRAAAPLPRTGCRRGCWFFQGRNQRLVPLSSDLRAD